VTPSSYDKTLTFEALLTSKAKPVEGLEGGEDEDLTTRLAELVGGVGLETSLIHFFRVLLFRLVLALPVRRVRANGQPVVGGLLFCSLILRTILVRWAIMREQRLTLRIFFFLRIMASVLVGSLAMAGAPVPFRDNEFDSAEAAAFFSEAEVAAS
jgi:hypothetical protein